jgi:hypothetical protein
LPSLPWPASAPRTNSSRRASLFVIGETTFLKSPTH